jgi:2-polyprenyl-6-methoxyphenol hydroxylase-like FAD-dependent oxidoreductase
MQKQAQKILVYGAGPLGSLFAARLQQGGNDVSILARGGRLANLREYGIVLRDVQTKEQTVTRVNVVETLAPEDAYDLVLVIMRPSATLRTGKNNALDILHPGGKHAHTQHTVSDEQRRRAGGAGRGAGPRTGADRVSQHCRLP